ncbi:MAG: hypothetical protein IJ412_11840 [Oscillospiraceae bacterium]|nr:hypothetical protein [Oscillospiraceae bacterium]
MEELCFDTAMDTALLRRALLGELIGIARAVDGSEHLIRPETDALLRQALAACGNRPDAETLHTLLLHAKQEKRALVPGCFACEAPCGRTAAYDLSDMDAEPAEVRAVKTAVLHTLFSAAKNPLFPVRSLYPALFSVGLRDMSAGELQFYLTELQAILRSAKSQNEPPM